MKNDIISDIALTAEKGHLTIEDKAELRKKIARLEEKVLMEPQIECELNHSFSPGVYARELRLKAGSIVIGKIHKHQNMNIISKGEVTFFSTDGAVQVSAPYTFVASPGVKRVIYAHEDTVWTTIHGTHLTDLVEIENEFIAKSYDEIPSISEQELKLIKGEQNVLDDSGNGGPGSAASKSTEKSCTETE